ncbi:MAG: hypothetical protein P9M00_10720 [Candidatus Tritonobacter lacicola]|nr:hypothetical protein [Candidatus Tritonobacter lacicola]
MKLVTFLIRAVKFALGLLLIPACIGVTVCFYESLLPLLRDKPPFLFGFAAYCIIFAIFQQPIRSYVFGHELTHAIWVLLFRGEVTGFSASAGGGRVEATKSNFLITLAPYFFPIYSILVLLVFYAMRLVNCLLPDFFELEKYFFIFVFLVGFSWAFHVVLTVTVMLKGQGDLKRTGLLFSLAIVYCMNVVALGLLVVFMSRYSGDYLVGEYVDDMKVPVAKAYEYWWERRPR